MCVEHGKYNLKLFSFWSLSSLKNKSQFPIQSKQSRERNIFEGRVLIQKWMECSSSWWWFTKIYRFEFLHQIRAFGSELPTLTLAREMTKSGWRDRFAREHRNNTFKLYTRKGEKYPTRKVVEQKLCSSIADAAKSTSLFIIPI